MQNVKGTYDYLPREQIRRQEVINTLQVAFERYGFCPIETPILNYMDVLSSKYAGGSEIMKEVYALTDQGNRDLGLRYDLTIPLSKFIGMNKKDLRFPFMKYEIGKVFRDGPIKLGRKREFIQADVDVIGSNSIYTEIELFLLTAAIAEMLNLKVTLKFNNRALLIKLLEILGVKENQMSSIILTIDKIEKISRKAIREELKNKEMNQDAIEELLIYLDLPFTDLWNTILSEADRKNPELLEFKRLIEITEYMNYTNELIYSENIRFEFCPSLARGLEVYTGTIWEVFMKPEISTITSSIAAGGRYDKIIGKFIDSDEQYPAAGMTFGVDVIMEVINEREPLSKQTPVEYLILPLSGYETQALMLANKIRRMGINVLVDPSGKKIKNAINFADKSGIEYMSIIGEDEVKNQNVTIKYLPKHTEKIFTMNEVSLMRQFLIEFKD